MCVAVESCVMSSHELYKSIKILVCDRHFSVIPPPCGFLCVIEVTLVSSYGGEEKHPLYSLIFCDWGLQIKLTKARLTEEKTDFICACNTHAHGTTQ